MKNLYTNLHKKYSLSKTLRFELIPVGKTKENIEKAKILNKDEHRAESYKKVKKYCDEYHKYFIDKCMNDFLLDSKMLEEYYLIYKKENKTEEDKSRFNEIQNILRTEISNKFIKDSEYNNLFGKEMINTYLVNMFSNNIEKLNEISEFKKFTTYFSNYNKSRQNLYVSDEKSTSIAYRLINENLPIFISNLNIFNKISILMRENINILNKELEEYLQVNSVNEIFELNYFNDALTQKGIELYNIIISGKSEENGNKIKGINEYINEYNQQHKETKLPKLRQLYKQMLSDTMGTSFIIDSINNDNELIEIIQNFYEKIDKILNSSDNRTNIIDLISNIDKFDLNHIYINNNLSITNLSNTIFDDWNKINNLLKENYDKNYVGKKKIGTEKYEEERKKELKKIKVYSINFIDTLINNSSLNLLTYFKSYFGETNLKEKISLSYNNCLDVFQNKYVKDSKILLNNEKAIEKIKTLLDDIKQLQEFLSLLIPKDNTVERDEMFYNALFELYNEIVEIIPLYNKVRNYLTQKPYSLEKIKLNFENDTLLDGWDLNKEKDNLGVLLKNNDKYYLGIINPYNKKIFENTECKDLNTACYQKMEYKLLPGPNKMLPKVFFSKSRIDEFNPSSEILDGYEKGLHKKGENFDISFCHKLIDFFKTSIEKHEEWKNFNFEFSDTNTYKDIGEFYKEVEKQGYKINFKNYSDEYINSLVEIGDLYLFQIYNKDFSPNSHGNPNLHTMYWKALFSDENLNNIVYKLNGQAEIFYRKASVKLENTAIHNKNIPIENKNPNNPRSTSIFKYDLIKNKRYTVDKFQFHVPITINFINEEKNNLNEEINTYLKYNDVNVIGIDRGERNLLYLTVIDSKGKIIEQYSLNEIINNYNDIEYKTDYHKLLDNKEQDRKKARESWKTVENIKELKEGYLSQVIHKIAELLNKYNAIIVLEDLNKGFKNSRIKVEKQVYQKFEKMLIDKLNYLVFKDKQSLDEGGLLNAYQLTNQFESFKKLGKQTGILFYIPAWCTSKIDPTTGFVNLLNIKYESVDKSKEFLNKYDKIIYKEKENYFEFYMDYTKFTNKSYGIKKDWIVCTNGKRIETFRDEKENNNWNTREIDLTLKIKELFNNFNINLDGNLKEKILMQDNTEFFTKLLKYLKLTYQMRNSIPNTEEDYLISPVKNKNGIFFNSKDGIDYLPKDADANGAYNIARKGLMLIEQIRNTEDNNLKKIKFEISNQKWLEYVQGKEM